MQKELNRIDHDTCARCSMQFSSPAPLIEIQGLSISLLNPSSAKYESIVEDVQIVVPRGVAIGMTGISGGGKSTAIRAIAGVLPDSAKVTAKNWTVFGTEVLSSGASLRGSRVNRRIRKLARDKLFLISQDARSALVPYRNIRWHLNSACATSGRRVSDRNHAELLKKIGFKSPEQILERFPSQLAGGECQRIQLAIARYLEVQLLLADEPFSFVDSDLTEEFVQLLKHNFIKERKADEQPGILFVSHNTPLLRDLTSYAYVMCHGRVVEEGPSGRVLSPKTAGHPHTRMLLQMSDPAHRIRTYRTTQVDGQNKCVFAMACVEGDETCDVQLPAFEPVGAGQKVRCIHNAENRDRRGHLKDVDKIPMRPTSPGIIIEAKNVRTLYAVDVHSDQRGGHLIPRSLTIKSGQRFGLSGPSGCGKTTFARMLIGLNPLSSGVVERFEDPSLREPLDRHKRTKIWERIQWVSQDSDVCIDPQSTVGETILQAYRAAQVNAGRQYLWKVTAELLARFRLEGRLMNSISAHISGGERRRVSIARALAAFGYLADMPESNRDRLLILDEPTVGIDAFLQTFLTEVLLNAQESLNLTYLIISHDKSYLDHLCDRIEYW